MYLLATDYTGMIELMAWATINFVYSVAILVSWTLLFTLKFRKSGHQVSRTLAFLGVILLLALVADYRTEILYHNRNNWSDFLRVSAASCTLFLAALITFLLSKPAGNRPSD